MQPRYREARWVRARLLSTRKNPTGGFAQQRQTQNEITVCFSRKTSGAAVRVSPLVRHAAPLRGRRSRLGVGLASDSFTHITGRTRRVRVPLQSSVAFRVRVKRWRCWETRGRPGRTACEIGGATCCCRCGRGCRRRSLDDVAPRRFCRRRACCFPTGWLVRSLARIIYIASYVWHDTRTVLGCHLGSVSDIPDAAILRRRGLAVARLATAHAGRHSPAPAPPSGGRASRRSGSISVVGHFYPPESSISKPRFPRKLFDFRGAPSATATTREIDSRSATPFAPLAPRGATRCRGSLARNRTNRPRSKGTFERAPYEGWTNPPWISLLEPRLFRWASAVTRNEIKFAYSSCDAKRKMAYVRVRYRQLSGSVDILIT